MIASTHDRAASAGAGAPGEPATRVAAQFWFEVALTPDGWRRDVRLEVANGRIVRLESGAAPLPTDERHSIAVPGMPNVHSHAFQRLLTGLTSRRGPGTDSFWRWRETMYRLLPQLTPEDLEAVAAQAYVEMLEAGFVRVGEFHYLHHAADGVRYANLAELGERVLAAARDVGIGITLLPVFYAHSGFGGLAPQSQQLRFVCGIDEYARLVSLLEDRLAGDERLGIAPHSLRAVTPQQLQHLVALAAGRPLHVHAAEQVAEVEACVAWSGRRPVAWLLDEHAVGPSWCLVHATHMDADEIQRLAASGATAGLCPVTEADLGDGVFPAVPFLAAGGRFGIGTDSNVLIDLAQELRLLEYGQRLVHRARNVLAITAGEQTGAAIFVRARAGGERALGGMDAGLAVGASADFVTLRADDEALAGHDVDTLLDAWIFGARSTVVDGVWRRGVRWVTGGRHRERERIGARYRELVRRLAARA